MGEAAQFILVASLPVAGVLTWGLLGRVCLMAYLRSDKAAAPWAERVLFVAAGPWGWWLLFLFSFSSSKDEKEIDGGVR